MHESVFLHIQILKHGLVLHICICNSAFVVYTYIYIYMVYTFEYMYIYIYINVYIYIYICNDFLSHGHMYKHAPKGPKFSCEASTPSTMTPVSGDPAASGPSTPRSLPLGLNPAMASLEIGPVEPVELFPATLVDTETDHVHHAPTLPPAMDGFEDTLVDYPARECYTTNHVNVTDGMLYAPDTQVYTNDMLFGSNAAVDCMASSSHETGVAYDPMVVDTQLYEHVDLNPPGPAYANTVCYTSAPEMTYDRPSHHTCMMYDTEMMELATHYCPHAVVPGSHCPTYSSDIVYGNGETYPHNEIFVNGVGTPVWPNDAVMTSAGYEVTSADSYWCAYDTAQPEAPCSTPMSMVSQFGSVAHGDSQYIPDEDLQVFFKDMPGSSSEVVEIASGSEEEMLHEVHQRDAGSICTSEHQAMKPCMHGCFFNMGTGASLCLVIAGVNCMGCCLRFCKGCAPFVWWCIA